MMFKNKKGDVPDMLLFLVLTFILAIGFFIFAFVIPQMTEGFRSVGLNDSAPEAAAAIDQLEEFGTVTIQGGFFFLMIGLILGTLISAFFARTHPIFMIVYIFFLAITIILGLYLGNAYQQLVETPIFADTLASQGLINSFMDNIISILLGVGTLSIILVFSKFSGGSIRGRQDL